MHIYIYIYSIPFSVKLETGLESQQKLGNVIIHYTLAVDDSNKINSDEKERWEVWGNTKQESKKITFYWIILCSFRNQQHGIGRPEVVSMYCMYVHYLIEPIYMCVLRNHNVLPQTIIIIIILTSQNVVSAQCFFLSVN